MANILLAAIVLAFGYFILQHVEFRQEGSHVQITYHECQSVPSGALWPNQQGTNCLKD